MIHDLINDAVSGIKNSERIGKGHCTLKPISGLLVDLLHVFQKEGYIGEFEVSDEPVGGSINVKLIKQINDCGIIKPRFSVKHDEFTKWEKRYLPARDFGVLIVSTPKGVMDHKSAKDNGLGGRLLAYVY